MRQLLIWIINNLLTEEQLAVIPPGYSTTLRNIGAHYEFRGKIK